MDQIPINTPPRSPSRQHLEARNDCNPMTRHAKFVESTEPHRDPSPHPHLSPPRRYSLGENHRARDQHQPAKKTSFILGDDEHHVIEMDQERSGSFVAGDDHRHVIDIESDPVSKLSSRQQTLDASKTNHHHHPRNDASSGPQEQV
uniref:Inwardly rectifying potassium channel n=1 Tax=Apis cerana TaxID=7461 RepID=V9IG96_APICE